MTGSDTFRNRLTTRDRSSLRSRANRSLLCTLAYLFLLFGVSTPLRADDNETLEKFLTRLGLTELQTEHLEQVLETMKPGENRRKVAERLADLYAGQLVEQSENKAAYDAVLKQIEQLVQNVPEAKTASLEVMLLQADYVRAEAQITKWISDRKATNARDEALAILTRIAPQLDARQQQLQTLADRLLNELDNIKDQDEQQIRNRELSRTEAVAARASFFAAWANYYLALAGPDPAPSNPSFIKARDIFRRILGVDGGYKDIEPSSFGLESIWRSRTVIGLGLAEAACGNLEGSKACFDLLERGPAPAEIRELVSYWRLQSLLNANQFTEAVKLAEGLVANLSGQPSQGRVSLCVAMVRAGFGGQTVDPNWGRQLGMLGITGLIKMKQQSALRELVDAYNIPLDKQSGFYLTWLRGQQQLELAEKSKKPEDYTLAAETFTTALNSPDAKGDLAAAAQCRYQLAWCQYRLGQFEQAAKNYEQARDGLKPSDPKTAVESAWMAFVSYQSLAKTQRQFISAAISVLAAIQRDFPNHPYAKRSDYYIGKLQQSALSAAETIANLQRVPANSQDYLPARFDICQLLYSQWRQADADEKQQAAEQLVTAVDQYLDAAKSDPDHSRKLRVSLFGIDAVLSTESMEEATAERLLSQSQRWTLDDSPIELRAEHQYRSLQLATRRGDETARRRHANWIVDNARGSSFELPALIVLAKVVEARAKSAKPPTPVLEEGLHVYARLVEYYGDSPDVMKTNKNAQVSLSRLAHFSYELGRYSEASEQLRKLLEQFPNEPNYLRRAGLAEFNAKEFSQAVERWRTLTVALPKDSEGWFEAKYYQLACLAQTDRPKAVQAMQQFKLLYPAYGDPSWREKFKQLESTLR